VANGNGNENGSEMEACIYKIHDINKRGFWAKIAETKCTNRNETFTIFNPRVCEYFVFSFPMNEMGKKVVSHSMNERIYSQEKVSRLFMVFKIKLSHVYPIYNIYF